MRTGLIIIIVIIIFDQLTKRLAAAMVPEGHSIIAIRGLLEFGYHKNFGISFGLLAGQQLLFALITIIALTLFGYLFLDVDFRQRKVYSIAISLFIGGTFGNAIDRALLGYVIDFLHFPFLTIPLSWVRLSNFYNNIADLALSAAIVLFLIDIFIFEPKRHAKKEATDHATDH